MNDRLLVLFLDLFTSLDFFLTSLDLSHFSRLMVYLPLSYLLAWVQILISIH